MKNSNVKNKVESKICSILLDDKHFLFGLKKKNTSSMWSYFNIKNNVGAGLVSAQKGITLIALVITIIIMLILVGVVLNLTIGENRLFGTAKYAHTKTEESSAREKLELALLDLQTQKYTNKDYNQNEYLNRYLENREMIIEGDIVTIGNWDFQIDRTIPQIIGDSEQIETKVRALISTPYVGTKSATIKIQYITNEEEIESYTYILDGEEIITNESKEYTLEDYLEPETTYKVQVIARYKNNLIAESNIVTIKTEAKTYLFNDGDTCDAITGGWSAMAGPEHLDVSMKAPTLTFDKNEKAMDVYLESTSYWFTGGILKINKKIDYKQYKKICVEAVAALSSYNQGSIVTINASNSEEFYNTLGTICYEYPISEKTKFELNIYELEEIEDIYFYIQATGVDGPVGCAIYNVWLEK